MTLTIAVFSEKGGTGKTTATAHLGVSLANRSYRVLAVDLAGKQGDLGKHFGVWSDVSEQIDEGADWPNVSTMFTDRWPDVVDQVGTEGMILETDEGVDLLPAHPDLDGVDHRLARIDDPSERYDRLERALADVADEYDVVLLDLPGSTSNVTLSGLWAAGRVVAPVEMGPFESGQLLALDDDLAEISSSWPVDVELELVLPNKVDDRTRLAGEYLEQLAEAYPDVLAPAPIPASQDLRNAAEQGRTAYALPSPSSTARRALEAFDRAAGRLVADHRADGGLAAFSREDVDENAEAYRAMGGVDS